jgi:hypothetical protein
MGAHTSVPFILIFFLPSRSLGNEHDRAPDPLGHLRSPMNSPSKSAPNEYRDRLEVLDLEPQAFAFLAWQNVIIAVWRAQPTKAAVGRLAVRGQSITERYPRHSAIHIVHGGTGVPAPEARAAFVELMKGRASKLACVAAVLLGHGFWASALQGAITGMHMLAPHSLPLRICDSIEVAADWLPDEHFVLTGVAINPGALHNALREALIAAGAPASTRV